VGQTPGRLLLGARISAKWDMNTMVIYANQLFQTMRQHKNLLLGVVELLALEQSILLHLSADGVAPQVQVLHSFWYVVPAAQFS